jgi:hypothetical protein
MHGLVRPGSSIKRGQSCCGNRDRVSPSAHPSVIAPRLAVDTSFMYFAISPWV